jgi:hypothetical protein
VSERKKRFKKIDIKETGMDGMYEGRNSLKMEQKAENLMGNDSISLCFLESRIGYKASKQNKEKKMS